MDSEPPADVPPLSALQLIGLTVGTFLVLFLVLEAVDPRWIELFRPPAPSQPAASQVATRGSSAARLRGPVASRSPGAQPSAAPLGTDSAADRSEASTTASGEPALAIVVETQGSGARLRADPGSQAATLQVLSEGTVVELTGQDLEADDHLWVQARAQDGTVGWVAADFLAAYEPGGSAP